MKKLIKRWLGIDDIERKIDYINDTINNLVNIGIDTDFNAQTQIIICSKLNGGQVRIISSYFTNIKDLENFVDNIKAKFRTEVAQYDVPNNLRKYLYS